MGMLDNEGAGRVEVDFNGLPLGGAVRFLLDWGHSLLFWVFNVKSLGNSE